MATKLLRIRSARSYGFQLKRKLCVCMWGGDIPPSFLNSFVEVLASLCYHAISLILKWKEASFKSQETSSCGSKRSGILQN